MMISKKARKVTNLIQTTSDTNTIHLGIIQENAYTLGT